MSQTTTDNAYWSYPASAASIAYTPNTLDQYTAIGGATPTYDANGNLTFDGTTTYTYDAESRLTSASQGGSPIATYTYDARGYRKSQTVGGTTTILVNDADNNALLDYGGAGGSVQRWYVWGQSVNALLGQVNTTAGTRVTLIPDIQGSIIGSLSSNTGTLTKAGFQTYGESTSTANTNFGYTGARLAIAGLYDMRARFYSPAIGRFLSTDPIGSSGGVNLYAYVGNDPLNFTDPSGLMAEGFGQGIEYGSNPFNIFDSNALQNVANIAANGSAGRITGFVAGEAIGAIGAAAAMVAPEIAMGRLAAAMAGATQAINSSIKVGTPLYRVFGDEAVGLGRSFTTINPASVSNYRETAGLFSGNTGRFVLEGTLNNTKGVTARSALPGPGGIGGGLPEVVVPNPQSQITIQGVYGVNPPF
jgi:RHS repeat-associated protein